MEPDLTSKHGLHGLTHTHTHTHKLPDCQAPSQPSVQPIVLYWSWQISQSEAVQRGHLPDVFSNRSLHEGEEAALPHHGVLHSGKTSSRRLFWADPTRRGASRDETAPTVRLSRASLLLWKGCRITRDYSVSCKSRACRSWVEQLSALTCTLVLGTRVDWSPSSCPS